MNTDGAVGEMINAEGSYANLSDEARETIDIVYDKHPAATWDWIYEKYKNRGAEFIDYLQDTYNICHSLGLTKSELLDFEQDADHATKDHLQNLDPDLSMD